jgi:putative flippase GtrA
VTFRRQFVCYAVIGLVLNLILYGVYLVLTYMGMPALVAMTLTYSAGVLGGFMLNRSITFRYRGGKSAALLRYLASYGIGYAINFVILWLLVVRMGLSHQIVQGGITLGLPIVLFALQKFWVFRPRLSDSASLAIRSAP